MLLPGDNEMNATATATDDLINRNQRPPTALDKENGQFIDAGMESHHGR